jgi:chemosensory pili system protein ChpA (sensor histidine kinase/response regulator)
MIDIQSALSSQFDTGPLSWVIGEIREALERSANALHDAAGRSAEAQPTLLLHAKSHLHQAHGALQMVDVPGTQHLTEAAERAIDRFKEGQLALDAERAAVVGDAYQALVEYLEELLDGAAPQPVRLFPYYRALQEMLGVERIGPGALLALDPMPRLPGAVARIPLDYAAARARYEKALLPFLKSAEPAQREHAAAMRDALALVVDAHAEPRAHAFWLALKTVADLVALGKITPDLYIKQLFGHVNMQLRRVAQGHADMPDQLLRDALFFVAEAAEPTLDARMLRTTWGIEGQVPPDYLARRYGRVDPAALKDAKAALADIKGSWDRTVTDGATAAEDSKFDDALARLAGASDKLGAPALTQLLRELKDAAARAVTAGRTDRFDLEMASAMLFIEHGLDQVRQLPDDFAQHAAEVGRRLLALAEGMDAPEAPQWHGELARELQQGQTVSVLAGEIRAGLRQVEKIVDEYYENPAKRTALSQADPMLHQLAGALAILDQDGALRTVGHVRDSLRDLAAHEPDEATSRFALDNLAHNIGSLGFFTDALAQNVDSARRRFRFDEEEQVFRELPFDALADAAPVVEALADVADVADAHVANAHIDRVLDADPAAGLVAGQEPALPEPEAEAPAPGAPPVAAPQPMFVAAAQQEAEADADAIEAELLEIFITEAQEVLALVADNLPVLRAAPGDQETLTRVRRAFHTLKGSSRMVGLERFAVGAAAVEKVMNLWLSEQRVATADLLAMLEHAHADLTSWVAELAAGGGHARSGEALAEACARLQAGGPFVMDATPESAVAAPEAVAEAVHDVEPDIAPDAADMNVNVDVDPSAAEAAEPVVDEVLEAVAREDGLAPFAEMEAEAAAEAKAEAWAEAAARAEMDAGVAAFTPAEEVQPQDELATEALLEPATQDDEPAAPHNVVMFPLAEENIKRIGGLEIPLPLYNIYLGETADLVQALDDDFADWRDDPLRAVSIRGMKAAHTLGGTSATVGYQALRELAVALEEALLVTMPPLSDDQHLLLQETLERVRVMLEVFGLGELAPAQPELLARLTTMRDELGHRKADAVFGDADPELTQRMDELFNATFSTIVDEPSLVDEIDSALAQQLGEPVVAAADDVSGIVADAPQAPVEEEQPHVFAEDEAFAEEEPQLAAIEDAQPEALADEEQPLVFAEDEAFAEEAPPELQAEPQPEHEPEQHQPFVAETVVQAASAPVRHAEEADLALTSVFADELDQDLLPIFMEEAADLLPQIGNDLRRWQQNPQDAKIPQSLQRALHTVKGSARMAGAMRLGQHTHALETQIENMVHAGTTNPAAFEELLTNYDQAQLLYEALRHGDTAAQPAFAAPAVVPEAAQPAAATARQPRRNSLYALPQAPVAQPAVAQQASQTPLVRVRADILDRLVNQAGEVSITRSKLENQVDSLRGVLSDFSDNVTRLRRQLREVEMQAESQIASRMSIAGERGFDPLEFDRFTRLQELTRMMAESVDDIASFHDSLARSVDGASEDLAAQSRLTRELQRDLMRARMVPFASLSERLFRVARQTAKETDKRVNLDIRGGGVEIDRSVLERMAAPFEHLLRNAIVHGIEARNKRLGVGKAETGELLVQVSQQGNEVAIRFSDDGAGLNLDRIRTKARTNGLLQDDRTVSDQEAVEMIFEPGFSTAESLTELAGRGIGMDVVRSEARALGGRIEIVTETGRGATFTIHLPLTLAVTQVVLVSSGTRTYALPANQVELLLQVRDVQLAAARAEGSLAVHGEQVRLHYLPDLLREPAGLGGQRSCPVLILRGGGERLALQVDAVLGNREVVVKNIGPQLARMPGIAGATVFGSGEIVLILDPVQLAGPMLRVVIPNGEAAPVIEAAPYAPAPVAKRSTVMVVDDSLTVRKVTQRLLEREGFRVLLAKDGVDALEQMPSARPDLMLVDIEMPRMDGFDLTRNVRGNDATRGIPIIMITSRTADKHRNMALGLGVDAYFGKPFQEDVLLAAITGLLGREMPVV